MSPRNRWRAAFLGLTVLVVGMELFAAFDSSDETSPWTDMIVSAVPAEVAGLLLGALLFWLPIHFGIRYWRKHRTLR